MLAALCYLLFLVLGLVRFDVFARGERLLIVVKDIAQACARRLIRLVRSGFLREELHDPPRAGAREGIAERLGG